MDLGDNRSEDTWGGLFQGDQGIQAGWILVEGQCKRMGERHEFGDLIGSGWILRI